MAPLLILQTHLLSKVVKQKIFLGTAEWCDTRLCLLLLTLFQSDCCVSGRWHSGSFAGLSSILLYMAQMWRFSADAA